MSTRPAAPVAAVVALVALWALGVSACSTVRSSAAEPVSTATGDLGADGGVGSPGFDAQDSFDPAAIDTVVMIGDSITVASTAAITAAFDELGFAHVIVALPGKRIAVNSSGNPSGVTIAEWIVGGSTDLPEDAESVLDDDHANELWVIALGSNDINQYSNPAARVAATVERMPPAE